MESPQKKRHLIDDIFLILDLYKANFCLQYDFIVRVRRDCIKGEFR